MARSDNKTPRDEFAPENEPGNASKGETQDDFDEILKKAGDEVLGGSRKERDRRTAAVKEVDALKEKLAEAEDQRLRAMAELENFRQRKNKELADQEKYAPMKLARDILPVWDNLGRALEAAPADESVKGFVEGVKMVYDQLLDVLAKNHVVRIPTEGEKFDPNVHESIAMFPSDAEPNTVINEARPGFVLHDRVVRHAQVVIAAPKPAEPKKNAEDDASAESEPAE